MPCGAPGGGGWINFLAADELAVALSLHPYEVFGDLWWCTC